MDANFWGEHEKWPRSDWQIEVENGDTLSGYWQWVEAQIALTAEDEPEEVAVAVATAPQVRTQHDDDCARRFHPTSECTCGFNEETEWTRALKAGDRVKWNDPDGGICSRTVIIGAIDQDGDDSVMITVVSGDCIEALRSERSQS
jgi:hypothetical protein